MPIELVVFDMAGTTIHDPGAVAHSFEAALAAASVPVQRDRVTEVMGLPKRAAVHRLVAGTPAEHFVDAIHADFVQRMRHFYENDPDVREIRGAASVFRTLNLKGVRVALNTGFCRAIAATILDRLGWDLDGRIDASITSDEVPNGRPAPDMIARLRQRLHIQYPERVAKVGDTPVDLEEGKNAGCGLIIGVTTGAHARAQLENYPHTHIVDSISDVPNIVLDWKG